MKLTVPFAFIFSLAFPALTYAADAAKPNVILIYSDDHGWADLGVQGSNKDIRTPNLDAMARGGVRFPHGYVSAPQCVPSRAGVLTGRYQQRFGVEANGMGPLPLEEITIAERLKPAGYISCQVGKWHLEHGREDKLQPGETARPSGPMFLPSHQGFDEYYCGPMNSFVASNDLQGNKLPDAPRMMTDKRFRCLWQTDAALSFIGRHTAEPFFLYLAYFTPHVPLESPEPWFSRTPKSLPKERRQALAMIAAMDEGIGKIRAELREAGIEKNTLLFFISDNGAPVRKGAWDGSLNVPLVGEKGMLTDGGVRTPFLAEWPGKLAAGTVYQPPVLSLDVAATANALAGLPHDGSLDGTNLMPYLLGEKSGNPHDALYWRWRSQAAIRTDRWKYIMVARERYLFDLDAPDGESELAKNNLLTTHPDIAAELEKKLMAWNAQLPPPGLPREVNKGDELFFDAHVKGMETLAETEPSDPLQGWVGRGCTLTVADGALHISAGKNAGRPFITRNGLDLAGPVTATLRVRCPAGGKAEISWRTKGMKDFANNQSAATELPATATWQDVKVELPAKSNIIHIRIAFPGGKPPDISAIEFRGAEGVTDSRW